MTALDPKADIRSRTKIWLCSKRGSGVLERIDRLAVFSLLSALPPQSLGQSERGPALQHLSKSRAFSFKRPHTVNDRPGVIERAFQIAKSGKVGNIKDVRTQLAGEGYSNVNMALTSRSLAQQISRMIIEAKAAPN